MKTFLPALLLAPALFAQSGALKLGDAAPAISLPGVDGKTFASKEVKTPLTLVVFLSAECPYVRATEDRINQIAKDYTGKLTLIGVNSNDTDVFPSEGLKGMRARSDAKNYVFPYLRDDDGAVARAYGAACTPDFFLFDSAHKLAYRGRMDDSWSKPEEVKKRDLREAIDALLAGKRPDPNQSPSRGCSIKWKKN
jgi:peroxiredoxin